MAFSLHVEALAWLRFGKRLPWVCTEGGRYSADVLGADAETLIEVEVKVSRSDFRADFRHKVEKHRNYLNPPPGRGLWVPNYFYFLVPKELGPAGLEILAENQSPAGLLVLFDPMTARNVNWYGRAHIKVGKRAVKIHDRRPSPGIIKELCLRQASELVTLRLRLENGGATYEELRQLQQTPDWEVVDEAQLESDPLGRQPHQGEDAATKRDGATGEPGAASPPLLPAPNCS